MTEYVEFGKFKEGDKVLLTSAYDVPEEEMESLITNLEEHFPGVHFVFISGVEAKVMDHG